MYNSKAANCTANDVKVSFGSLEIFVCGGAVQEKLRILLRYILKADAAWRAYLRVHTQLKNMRKMYIYLSCARVTSLISKVSFFHLSYQIYCVCSLYYLRTYLF